MQVNELSTVTMIKVAQFSEDRSEQCAMLEAIKNRRDVFNLEPVLQMAINEEQHWSVRRAAIECAAIQNRELSLHWMRSRAENSSAPVGQRTRALQALAALQLPKQTLPVMERVATSSAPAPIRAEAVGLIGRYRNLRSVAVLTVLMRNPDPVIARAAGEALEHLMEGHGGRSEVVKKMMQRAELLQKQGNRQAAREVLETASWLEPYNGKLLYKKAKLAVA
jgi:HEAT repeat protein